MVTMKIEASALAEVMKTAKRVCKKSQFNEIRVINKGDSAEFIITDGIELYVYRLPSKFDKEECNMSMPIFDMNNKIGYAIVYFEGDSVQMVTDEGTITKHTNHAAPSMIEWKKYYVDSIRNEALNSSEITINSSRVSNALKAFNGKTVKIEFGRTNAPIMISNEDKTLYAFVFPMKPWKE